VDPVGVTELRILHTADLDAEGRTAVRRLMSDVFDDVDDDVFENVLGGWHALVVDGGELVGHASVVQRRMMHYGRTLRAGYVEGVAVRAEHRRRGHGDAMTAALERIIRTGYDLGALGASEDGHRLYVARGWRLWRGPSAAVTLGGVRRTPRADGTVYVLPLETPLDLDGELVCDWRPGKFW
jgi:aminoglycoside 2'-N-acetyltransferase I